MITVGRYSKPEDAHLLRMKLGAGGVTVYLRDEFTTQMYWIYSEEKGVTLTRCYFKGKGSPRPTFLHPNPALQGGRVGCL